ncbi:GntR family transcriptional regulator [Companilactobacillus nodensis]|uniref:UbiC transcription regulator-associated n=1 Tax=Companilactobacillus nodensis DSM 19682 = JCM 14932 = NBRC 107160 TaxID=1423775 RepID=A0A0R1KGK0_9LACO|nr:GntR family transcriptional regulator [Companilactobacillus nodensis]KRK79050.1 UbiC transcription regulator-associated [Companilactobacillus nodensis DSM 19682 = JCM 14932 = NBRC 107160]
MDKKESLSQHLIDFLSNQILTEMRPNDRLPSERDLMLQFNVSRTTVRNALDKLELSGLVTRMHGKGTFVTSRSESLTNLADLFSFSKTMELQGRTPSDRIIKFKRISADEELIQRLNLKENLNVFEVDRIRMASGKPMMFGKSFLPAEVFENLTRQQLEEKSMYKTFEDDYNVQIKEADESCRASILNEKISNLLDEKPGAPCLRLERVTMDNNGRAIEYTISWARADEFNYRVKHLYR